MPIYLDHHATTPVDQRVLEAMLPYFTEKFGNAASIDHEFGGEALKAVEEARGKVASGINASSEEIIFTSGATESNNLAIKGIAEKYCDKGNHIITCITEHPSILDSCRSMEKHGIDVTYLPVDHHGMIDLEQLQSSITSKTILISIMAANNEIGVIAPLQQIGKIARNHNVIFHTDATQAIGYLPIDVKEMEIDVLSISGHKIYGPKGVGALYVRNISPRVKIAEQINGGRHERGMRSGTLNLPGIVGLGEAMKLAIRIMPEEIVRVKKLRETLFEGLRKNIEGVEINGHPTLRLPNNLNIYVPGIEARSLIVQLKQKIAISTGSACSTARVEPSHVISAISDINNRAHSSFRFGLGRQNDLPDINTTVGKFKESVDLMKKIAL